MDHTTDMKLRHIRVNAERLNTLSDRVNQKIEEIEDALEQIGVGVTVSKGPTICVEGVDWILGYGKIDGRWRFTARWPDQKELGLLGTPRVVRVSAVMELEAVLSAIIDRQLEIIRKLEESH